MATIRTPGTTIASASSGRLGATTQEQAEQREAGFALEMANLEPGLR